jgi:uncharacterized protein DUF1998
MPQQREARPAGRIRQSQLVTTFGPGAMVDLPEHSAIVAGLEHWGDPVRDRFPVIIEERLVQKLKDILGVPALKLYGPPPAEETENAGQSGIRVWQFPEWFVSTDEEGTAVRSRRLLHRRSLTRGKYINADKRRIAVVPIRFVQACPNGHVSDIHWYSFVHGEDVTCQNTFRALWLDERGTSGDLADVFIRCECRKSRSLVTAISGTGDDDRPPLGFCRGERPWLGKGSRETCGGEGGRAERNRLLVRSASNAYFPQVMSVISLPDRDELLRKAVTAVWEDFLQYVEDREELKRERKKAKVNAALEGFADDLVWREIQRQQRAGEGAKKNIKQTELETLLSSPDTIGEDRPDGDFYARTLALPATTNSPTDKLHRVILVHRLREVVAQVGFTRFEAYMPDIDGELSLDVHRADLAKELSWLPAIENRGEGFFIAFKPASLDEWMKRPRVIARVARLEAGFEAWKAANPRSTANFPGARYFLLHSLSHLLITAVSLECGYAASSIRERIYAGEAGSGILLHTGTSDAEGTLGGLVQVGRAIERHLRHALDLGRLCSNDPVCAQHRPDSKLEERFLQGAACHGCLLIAEPSCERRNEFLDRALVVPTVQQEGAELFREGEW